MRRGALREHWDSQAHMALFGVFMAAFVGMLFGVGGLLLQSPSLQDFILALCAGVMTTQIALAGRVLYGIYRHQKVGK